MEEHERRSILLAITAFENDEITLNDLQGILLQVCYGLGYEDRNLHKFLQRSEGQLDMLQFTVEPERVRKKAIEIIEEIKGWLTD